MEKLEGRKGYFRIQIPRRKRKKSRKETKAVVAVSVVASLLLTGKQTSFTCCCVRSE